MTPSLENISPFDEADSSEAYIGDPLSENLISSFKSPTNRLIRRNIFYRQRDIKSYINAVKSGQRHSIVTGIRPSGPIRMGHIIRLYYAKYLQAKTGAQVYIALSDDERLISGDESVRQVQQYTLRNLKDILSVGFNEARTTVIIDSADSGLIYPISARLSSYITVERANSIYGGESNVGEVFYSSVQCSQLLIPQLIYGEHPTVMISGRDQAPYLSLAREVADKTDFRVGKPSGLILRDFPLATNPEEDIKSSKSSTNINMYDNKQQIKDRLTSETEESSSDNDEVTDNLKYDTCYQLLFYFFEESDDRLREIYDLYDGSDMSSNDIKQLTVDKIWRFLSEHQARRRCVKDLEESLKDYRINKTDKQSSLGRIGYLNSNLTDS